MRLSQSDEMLMSEQYKCDGLLLLSWCRFAINWLIIAGKSSGNEVHNADVTHE